MADPVLTEETLGTIIKMVKGGSWHEQNDKAVGLLWMHDCAFVPDVYYNNESKDYTFWHFGIAVTISDEEIAKEQAKLLTIDYLLGLNEIFLSHKYAGTPDGAPKKFKLCVNSSWVP